MHEVTTAANLIEGILNGGSPVAVFPRREIAAALETGEQAQLWLELGREEDDDIRLLSLDVTPADLEKMLDRSNGDDILLALDGYALHGLFDDPDVEAHGLRGSLAVAVVAGAIAAPAGLAAPPQTSAAKPQVSTLAAQAQVSTTAASMAQSRPLAAKPADKALVSKPASKAQVSRAQVSRAQVARAQLSKSLVVKASGLRLLKRTVSR